MADQVPLDTVSELLGAWKKLKAEGHTRRGAADILGVVHGLLPDTVEAILKRYAPTVHVAQHYLQARSLKLAMRVVRKANVDQAIDILSRPNIGVLDPIVGKGGLGGGGFFLSVETSALGAVRIGVGATEGGSEAQASLPPHRPQQVIDIQEPDEATDSPAEDSHHLERTLVQHQERSDRAPAGGGESATPPDAPGPAPQQGSNRGCHVGPGRSKKVQHAIEQAKQRIAARRAQTAYRNSRRGTGHPRNGGVQGTHVGPEAEGVK